MARWLKRGLGKASSAAEDAKVRATVETLLADIAERGDAAVREMSVKFDGWDRTDYRLTDAEIRGCLSELTGRDLDDIRFHRLHALIATPAPDAPAFLAKFRISCEEHFTDDEQGVAATLLADAEALLDA